MVTRSSLDPLKEARARIRLRYERARPERALPKTLGAAATKVARDKLPEKGPAIGRLKLQWADIVGEQLARVCEPEKVGAGNRGRTLTVKCIPAASTMVQHQTELIRQRVSVSLGGELREIRIIQGPLSRGPAPKPVRRARPMTAEERQALNASAERIQDPALRKAVLALGEAVLTSDPDES